MGRVLADRVLRIAVDIVPVHRAVLWSVPDTLPFVTLREGFARTTMHCCTVCSRIQEVVKRALCLI